MACLSRKNSGQNIHIKKEATRPTRPAKLKGHLLGLQKKTEKCPVQSVSKYYIADHIFTMILSIRIKDKVILRTLPN